ncbi:MAG: 3-oxoacid CoA-transferase subunit A, partial [Treponema sp.]|nr:3-oxoacid CoA-transferase subunit A [Treponema sp.]
SIICSDGGWPDKGVGKLIANGQVKSLTASHVGLNPEVARRRNTNDPSEKLELTLVPQGTLAEQIRAAGAGLGGVLTPVGVGTVVADGKRIINFENRSFLLEKPIRAEFALIGVSKIDRFGNSIFFGTTRNFNPLMATAADYVIAGACEIVETGSLDPNAVHLSGVLVNAIVRGDKP